MPGATTKFGWPYPVDADPVDVAGDIQALAEAIDTDVKGLLIEGGMMSQQLAPMVADSNILTVFDTSRVPYVTRMYVWVSAWAGSDGGDMNGQGISFYANSGPSFQTLGSGEPPSVANRMPGIPLNVQWDVPAGGNAGWNVKVGWVTAVGTTYVGAHLTWQRFRI